MSYVNKSAALQQLQGLVQQNLYRNLDYMSDKFNEQQRYALEFFKKRIFLEEIIEETISFNKNIVWNNTNKNLKLTTTAEELIDVFKLRSDVYTDIGYQEECPDTIEGLNFDIFDKNSAIIYYKKNKEVTGTCRLIFDSENKLPSEEKYSFDDLRKKYNKIGEISRNIAKNNKRGLSLEFKYIMGMTCKLVVDNNIDLALSGIRKDHLKLFERFGDVQVLKELNSYGTLTIPFLIVSYNPAIISPFFKKAFLSQK